MRADWERTTLGEVVSFKGGGTPSTEKPAYWNGDIPWVSPKDMKSSEVGDSIDKITAEAIENSAASLIPKGTILVVVRSGILARTIPVAVTTRPLTVNQDIKALCPQKGVDPRFLHYFMQMSEPDILKLVTRGATVHRLSTDSLRALEFAKPPLVEQQRIVAILDEAFAGLATATANAEKNLNNARELFDSYCQANLTRGSESWKEQCLEDVVDPRCSLSYGIVQPGDEHADGLPIVRPVDLATKLIQVDGLKRIDPSLAEAYGRTRLAGDELLLCVRGSTGAVSIASKDLSGANVTRGIVPIRFDPTQVTQRFGYFALLSKPLQNQIKEKTYGTALMQINIRDLRKLLIPIPPLVEQERIVANLDALSDATSHLQSIYQTKLIDLRALKGALLQKAFSGELPESAVLGRVVDTRTASFAANILILAFEHHRIAGRASTFGHKKAQKLLHLVDAAARVDLGRDPLKDAAGPNDFDHMLRATDWAEQRQIFKFNKSDSRYIFQRLQHYKRGLEDAKHETEKYSKEIGEVIDLLLPMNSEKAEIVATVYAAWNNLLVKSKPVDDEEIVREAREDWHPEKMDIPRHKFFDAIVLLRRKKIIPTGQAKLVREKYLI